MTVMCIIAYGARVKVSERWDSLEARDAAVVRMWLACRTQEEIAEAVGMTQRGVGTVLEVNASANRFWAFVPGPAAPAGTT